MSTFCQKSQELIVWSLDEAFADEPASSEDQTFLKTHLGGCLHCRAYQESVQNLSVSMKELPEMAPPADLADRIMARIESKEGTPRAKVTPLPARGNLKKFIPLAAAAVLLVAIAIPVGLQFLPGKQPAKGTTVASTQPQLPPQPAPAVTSTTETTTTEATTTEPVQPETSTTSTNTATTTPQPQPAPTLASANPGTTGPVMQGGVNQTDVQTAPYQPSTEEIAMANVVLTPEDFTSNDSENDIYYDPMAELVGF